MTADTMVNTEMFYAPDACDRVVALFRSFGGADTVLSAQKSDASRSSPMPMLQEKLDPCEHNCSVIGRA
jgi:hypothetical protein